MTAHLTLLHSAHVLVVSDRLLTLNVGGTNTTWDDTANKTILVMARNGAVVVCYAGLAHIGGKPTDIWLVDLITRRDPNPGFRGLHGPRALLESGPPWPDLTIGALRDRIIEGIRTDFAQETAADRGNGLEVMISGWTWRRRTRGGVPKMKTILNFITPEIAATERGFDSLRPVYAARLGRGNYRRDASIGSLSGRRRHLEALFGGTGLVYEHTFEAAMVAELRDHAEVSNTTVGREYISVFLPWYGTPYVKYIRDPSHPPDGRTFWPAIVHWTGMVHNPAEATCSSSSFAGGIPLVVDPPCPPTTINEMGAQARRDLNGPPLPPRF